jgi:hypothetical protein
MTFHHGPEVLFQSTPSKVREVRSAVTYLNGTAPIGEVHATPAERADYINKLHVVRTREDAAKFGPDMAGYNIPAALDAIFDESPGGTIIVNNVFDPDTHTNGPSDVTTAELTGDVLATGERTGMKKARECYHRFGFFPKLYLSDRSSLPEVRTEMQSIAETLYGHAIVDMPTGLSPQQAIESRGTEGVADFNSSDPRLIICYPHIRVEDKVNGGTKLDPLSTALCGAIINQDLTKGGPNHSPSNVEIIRALDTETPIRWEPGDIQSETNLLNGAGIVTVRRGYATGIRTWGNRSAAFPTSSAQENFIHVQRILDAVHEAIINFLLEYTDRLGTPENIEAIEETANAFLRTKIGRGDLSWFYDARFTFPASLNSVQEIADGHFKYKLETAPVSIMERLTTVSSIDVNLINNALNLAA